MQALVEAVPLFWSESWRWAAPGWHDRYGAPRSDLDRYAARLFYSGWADCFSLPKRWSAPSDERWITLVHAPPDIVHGVVRVLGHLALLRSGAAVTLACADPADRWLRQALRYRDANCLHASVVAPSRDPSLSHACGVAVLSTMARNDWPPAAARFAMLAPPEVPGASGPWGAAGTSNGLNGATEAGDARCSIPSNAHATAHPLLIESIHTRRCLSICSAVIRHCCTESAAGCTK